MKTSTGYAVKIIRKDGSSFLAQGNDGTLPAVYTRRSNAVEFKRDLSTHIDKSRMKVVRVSYSYPEELPA